MYAITRESLPPSWRRIGDCSECIATEYCAEAAPGDDWVWDAGIQAHRAPTDGEILQTAITARIEALKAEAETYIDSAILPYTRGMLRDGVLDSVTTEGLRDFIADTYTEANTTIDAIEAVAVLAGVDDPAPIWPIYGGA